MAGEFDEFEKDSFTHERLYALDVTYLNRLENDLTNQFNLIDDSTNDITTLSTQQSQELEVIEQHLKRVQDEILRRADLDETGFTNNDCSKTAKISGRDNDDTSWIDEDVNSIQT